MDREIRKLILIVGGAIISLAMASNAYFITRLVDKVEKQSDLIWQLRQDQVILKISVEELRNSFDTMKNKAL